jgi:hypothetical protein
VTCLVIGKTTGDSLVTHTVHCTPGFDISTGDGFSVEIFEGVNQLIVGHLEASHELCRFNKVIITHS